MEVTVRTAHRRFLLTPGRELNRIFVGCLGRAHELFPVRIHAVAVLSNHFHLLISPENTEQMARFMGHLNGNLAKAINRLRGTSGSVFEERYKAIPVSDEPEAQIARLDYLLRQGTKEGLVFGPREWPGVHCAAALADGEALDGAWIHRTRFWHARSRGRDVRLNDFESVYRMTLEVLPCWHHLDETTWRQYVQSMLASIEEDSRASHRRAGTRPVGPKAICRADARSRPSPEAGSARRAPPRVHAFRRSVRSHLLQSIRYFEEAYDEAAKRLRQGLRGVAFPGDCFPPGLPYVAPES